MEAIRDIQQSQDARTIQSYSGLSAKTYEETDYCIVVFVQPAIGSRRDILLRGRP